MGCGASRSATSGIGFVDVKPKIQIASDAVYEYDIEDGKVGGAQSDRIKSFSDGSSPNQMDEYIDNLRGLYDINSILVAHSKWPPVRPIQYVELALAEVVGKYAQQTSSINRKQAKKIIIDQIAKTESGQYSRHVVVEGLPGIGKSTLLWQIGKKWSERAMFADHRVFVNLKLGDRNVRDAKDASDLFRHSDPEVVKAVATLATESEGRGFVLGLDGFDDGAVDLQGKSFIAKVLRGKELPRATLIMTARPAASRVLFQHRQSCGFQDQLIEVLGFGKKDVDAYIDRSLRSNAALVDSFRRYIGCHHHIGSLMSIPINCALLVETYRNHSGVGKPIPRTITELYVAFTQALLVLHEKDEAEQVDVPLSIESRTLQLHRDELIEVIQDPVGLSQSLCTTGVLTQAVFGNRDQLSIKDKNSLILNAVEARIINVPRVYHVFVDLLRKDQSLAPCVAKMATTFKQLQEGSFLSTSPPKWTCFEGLSSSTLSQLAAIAKLACERTLNNETIIHDLPDRAQTLGLLHKAADPVIASSLYSFLHPTLQEFLAAYHVMSLVSPQQKDFIKKIAAKSSTTFVMQFIAGLTNYQSSAEAVDMFTAVIPPNQDNICLDNLHLLFETHKPAYICSVIGSSKQNFHYEGVSLTPFDLYVLGCCIAHSTALWSIELQRCSVTDDHVRMLVLAEKGNAFHHITSLKLVRCDMASSRILFLEPVLKNNTCLTSLSLECNSIESDGAAAVAKSISHNTALTELNLSHCDLDDEAIHCLCIGISCCKLQKLDVSRNPLTKEGAYELSSVLKLHPTLKEVNLLECDDIEDEGATSVVGALKANTTLRVLRLDEKYRHLVAPPLLNRVKFSWS